jgi:hypothetical protein
VKALFLSAILCTAASLSSAAHYSIGFDDAALSSSLTGVDLGGAVFDSGAFVHIGPEGSRALLSSNDGSYTTPFRARFTLRGVTAVSVDLGDWGMDEDHLFLRAYDAAGSLLAQTTSYLPWYTAGMRRLSLSTEAEIASVVFYGAGWQGQNNVYADNLSFDTRDLPTVVPLPAAGVLLASGMAAFAWARRRSGRTGACRNAEN